MEHMERDPEGKQAMSLRLSKVLGNIGVNRKMVIVRRKTRLIMEKLETVYNNSCRGYTVQINYFGSQSEGTTTLGMESDIDKFCNDTETPVLLELSDWQPGRIWSLLVLKNENSPPQHCNLQMLRPDRPLPVTLDNLIPVEMKNDIEVDIDGRLLLKNTRLDELTRAYGKNEYIIKGPSRSVVKGYDIVYALSCTRRPDECVYLFRRPRPGHWPRPAILEKARKTQTYFVQQGYSESYHKQLEWRITTPSIDRLLMFDLNMIKLKVYTFLKVLRITYFKPMFGDRLSTFHFKTAFFFTVETYPPVIWKKNNLLQCVIYCLTTFERWCRIHYCPHYTISGVNLFVGKLNKFELPSISEMLSDMIENINNYVADIKMDRLGERMLRLTGTKLPIVNLSTRLENKLNILQDCLTQLLIKFHHLSTMLGGGSKEESAMQLMINYCSLVDAHHAFIQDTTEKEFAKDVFSMLIKSSNVVLASLQASVCKKSHQDITEEIIDQYQASMDVSSGGLKFASMLYCNGRYEKAAAVLKHIEELMHPDVWHFSLSKGRMTFRPSRIFLMKALDLPLSTVVNTSVALSVTFCRQELYCLPKHLIYEMYRTFTHTDFQQRTFDENYMDGASIESVPFLYFLQYLTYRQLRQDDKKRASVSKLADYLDDERNWHGYLETAYNTLGHCYELENRLDLAWQCYSRSLSVFPFNNAASWHMAILMYNHYRSRCDNHAF
ncbi:uncharacterized protein LOC128214486 [Mya arenaria]|uniref:uncharacterized protein LOC128214486 n=1 Tax=Mya arenaria TaxID=6604 RepID=UPI0022E67F54|nr:uncharacterized protein LOC128214486 [Mya arenaria]